jgi:hypothetical protein
MGAVKVLTTSPALRIFLRLVLVGQDTVLRGSVLLLAAPQSAAVMPGAYCPLMYHPDSQAQPATGSGDPRRNRPMRSALWRRSLPLSRLPL